MSFNNGNNDGRYETGIVVGLFFIFIFAVYIILLNHSKAYGQYINDQDTMTKQMYVSVIMCKKSDEEDLLYKFCRQNNDVSCEDSIKEYAKYIWKYSTEYEIDPWLVAALIYHESKYDAYVVSKKKARSIMQIHPGHKLAKYNKFIHNKQYRIKCKSIKDHCQEESIMTGIMILKEAINFCGSNNIDRGISAYNTGKCYPVKKSYVGAIKSIRYKMLFVGYKVNYCYGNI